MGMETKTNLGSVWIKSWFQTRRKKKNKNLKIKSEKRDAGERVTLSEDTQPDESIEKEAEAEGSDEKTQMFEKLKTKFEDLQSRYNVLAELLLQRSILTAQNDQVAAKVPTVDLTESSSSSEPAEQMTHYTPAAVSSYPPPHPPPHPPQSYPYHPHYYPPYYPPPCPVLSSSSSSSGISSSWWVSALSSYPAVTTTNFTQIE